MKVRVRGYGVIKRQLPPSPVVELAEPATTGELLQLLGLTDGGVWLIRVNGQHTNTSTVLREEDLVELVPPLGGG